MTTAKFWQQLWQEQNTPWSRDNADSFLVEEFESLVSRKVIAENLNIFIPLCGDSIAVKYFSDFKLKVTGLDIVPEALNSLVQKHFNAKKPDNLTLIQMDVFELQESAKYDLVYDRGAFVAINPEDRSKYIEIILKSLKNQGKIILEYMDFKQDEKLPPNPVSLSELRRLFIGNSLELLKTEKKPSKTNSEKIIEKTLLLITKL